MKFRYYVFAYNTYYPEGGMRDCALKTNNWAVALETATHLHDHGYYVHIYDARKDTVTYAEELE